MVSFLFRNQSKLLYREFLCLNMLKYNANMWKKKCPEKFKSYRKMIDVQEYFLWNQYGIKSNIQSKNDLEMKINNLGNVFHHPQYNYHLQNNGQLLFTSDYTLNPIKIGKPILSPSYSKKILFPHIYPNKNSICSGKIEHLSYLQGLMDIFHFF